MGQKLLKRMQVACAALVLPFFAATPVVPAFAAPAAQPATEVTENGTALVRYDTDPTEMSVASASRQFGKHADSVYLVNPYDVDSVLPIAAASHSEQPGPVLYVNADGTLPESVREEVGRLSPTRVVAVGGQALVSVGALETAAGAAQESLKTSGAEAAVQTEQWAAETPQDLSIKIAQALFPSGAKTAYLVDATGTDASVYASLAASMGDGPVLLVDPANPDSVMGTLDTLKPRITVAVGGLDSKTWTKVSGKHPGNQLLGGSIDAVALNAASARTVPRSSAVVVASADDPASMLIAAQNARGPFLPLATGTTVSNASKLVSTANTLSGASAGRFIAYGKTGSGDRVFTAPESKTLAGGLTSIDVKNRGTGALLNVSPPAGLKSTKGKDFTYVLQVEDGLPVDSAQFATEVAQTLNDPRGWGRNFKQVRQKGDTTLVLASPKKVDELCAPLDTAGETSCHNGNVTVINIDRWVGGAQEFLRAGGTVQQYRQYVLNHEMGHAIGYGHQQCLTAGALAPVMMQQTLHMQACRPNPWPKP
ncbi:DUF3152 domain-containing protein [Gleimia hominis]|uniref:DUF3152 domain-containing protein n=1 Tax=Gleimia hominis TaxID=595468 RepID=UPI000C805CC2|nr:DUF3152 domain-containing protein [Gleimia hominis]WIK64290.1 DUF3152 domain-containing protein [Gleimia hominis]